MSELQHDPIPDGRSGPWLRKRHARTNANPFMYAFDERCAACRLLVWAGQTWTRSYPLLDDEGLPTGTLLVRFHDGVADDAVLTR